MLLQELLKLSESEADTIKDLPKGNKLFDQRFVYFGIYDASAKKIIDEKLTGRFAIVTLYLTYGPQGYTDRNSSLYVDLGPSGHGFADKSSASRYITVVNKFHKLKAKRKEGSDQDTKSKVCKIADIDKTLDAVINDKQNEHWALNKHNVGLAYAE